MDSSNKKSDSGWETDSVEDPEEKKEPVGDPNAAALEDEMVKAAIQASLKD